MLRDLVRVVLDRELAESLLDLSVVCILPHPQNCSATRASNTVRAPPPNATTNAASSHKRRSQNTPVPPGPRGGASAVSNVRERVRLNRVFLGVFGCTALDRATAHR